MGGAAGEWEHQQMGLKERVGATGRGTGTDFSLLENYEAISRARNVGTATQTPFEFTKAFLANKKPPTSTLWLPPSALPGTAQLQRLEQGPKIQISLFPQVLLSILWCAFAPSLRCKAFNPL